MAAKDNAVFSMVLQLSDRFPSVTPESVLFGYAKLISMNEGSVKNLLDEAGLSDLDKARKKYEERKLNIELIKNGTMVLMHGLKMTVEQEEQYKEFAKFLEEADAGISSVEILEKVFASIVIPIDKVYAVGCTMDDVFAYKEQQVKEGNISSKQETSVKQEETKGQVEDTSKQAVLKDRSKESDKAQVNESNGKLYELSERYRKLSAVLYDVIKGQDSAIAKFVQGCYQGELLKGVEKKKQPQAYFFFFGPPGVGKTFLAETAAEHLGRPHMTFNMSEYVDSRSVDTLIGTSKHYSNSREGSLVKFVRENPNCLLIFDEIEKADIAVIRLFLQILGSGRLHNVSREEETSFENAIVIFTSNVGKELYADRSVNLTTLPERVIIDAIQQEKNAYGQQVLPNEICSRIASGNTIMFNHLSIRHLADMARSNFEKISRAMSELYGCHVTYTTELPLLFLYNRGGEIDARVASNQSANFLKREIYELSRQLENAKAVHKETKAIHFDIEWDGIDSELKKLFVNDVKTEVLFLANEAVQEQLKIDTDKYTVYFASNIEQAREYLNHDIVATFIDPFYGKIEDSSNILSITDYSTEGIQFFYELAETQTSTNIYLMEVDKQFTEIDRRTFMQIGAADTMTFDSNHVDSFMRLFEQTLDEVYMEKVSSTFSQQGWVIDYKTKQSVEADGKLNVLFYDLKKRQAVDMESRKTLLTQAERPNVRFDDVIGAKDAKEELLYFIDYLKNPKKFVVMGGKPPKGVLLYGPPGTGKTMLAKAMAGESDVTFIETSAAEFMGKYVGQSEENVRNIFKKARKYAPSILFIDEIDAIGKQRTGSESTATRESTLNTLLTEMDGFSSNNKKPVFVLAATNYGVGTTGNGIAALDEALMRRFDNKIYVDLPNEQERLTYIKKIISKKGANDISEQALENVAERTTGLSLSILQNVIELAYRNASKQSRMVNSDDLLNSLEQYLFGEKKERTPEYYRSVAIHEAGHAYISYISGDHSSYITIESRGDFGGYVQHENAEDIPSYTREDFLAKIRISLAGRASEQVFLGKEKSVNTGASSDLRTATHYAFQMICTYGMEEGQLITLSKEEILQSPMAGEYIKQVNTLLDTEMKKTIALIEEGRDVIQRIVNALVAKNHLTGEELKELMQ